MLLLNRSDPCSSGTRIIDRLPHASYNSSVFGCGFDEISCSPPAVYILPSGSDDSRTERFQQAFIGHNNLSPDTQRKPLRLHVRNTSDGRTYIGENEALSLGDCLPIAAVCHEARYHAIKFCRSRVESIKVDFLRDPTSDVRFDAESRIESLPRAVVQAKTVTFTRITEKKTPYGEIPIRMPQFESAARIVDFVTKLCGNGVEHLIFDISACSSDYFDTIYWPHAELSQVKREP